MTDGRLIKGIGGFYYVETADAVYECKARGIFRKQKITPLVGDLVSITVNSNGENTIDTIYPRKNFLVRPPLANIDILFIVASVVDPAINTTVIDRITAIAEYKNIEPVIVLTKIDLDEGFSKYRDIYTNAGFRVILCNNNTGRGSDEIRSLVDGKICAFTGNTGVGKSSLLNSVDSRLNLEIGETSKKLGRGKHTTRQCRLFKVGNGYIADTPGFSSLETGGDYEFKEKLISCFPDLYEYSVGCRFTSCTHTCEKGCGVIAAAENGEIQKSRLESYKALFEELKDIKPWQAKR